MTANQISWQKVQEEQRSNLAQEAETNRHNIMQEYLSLLGIQNQQAQMAETHRSNVAREQETIRYDDMTYSTNVERNEIAWGEAQTKSAAQEETERHNTAVEAEERRHNETSEMIQGIGNALNFLGALGGTLAKIALIP